MQAASITQSRKISFNNIFVKCELSACIVPLVLCCLAILVVIGLGVGHVSGRFGTVEIISLAGVESIILIIACRVFWLFVKKPNDNTNTIQMKKVIPKNFFSELREEIQASRLYEPASAAYGGLVKPGFIANYDYLSMFAVSHEVIPNVFLGDEESYLSIDPAFDREHFLKQRLKCLFDCEPSYNQMLWAKNNFDAGYCTDKNIKTVISVLQNASYKVTESLTAGPNLPADINHIKLQISDINDAWERIEPSLDRIFHHIDEAIAGNGNILIHCRRGETVSAAIIYAYLINRCGVSLLQAYNYVKLRRHQVVLKEGMYYRLRIYEKKCEKSKR